MQISSKNAIEHWEKLFETKKKLTPKTNTVEFNILKNESINFLKIVFILVTTL